MVVLDLGAGTATVDGATDQLTGIERVIGSGDWDTMTGSGGDDTLEGGLGNDTLAGRGGADVLDGGSNFDMVDYRASVAGVSINLATGAASGGDATGDTLIGIEDAQGSNTGGDTIVGSNLDNYLYGNGGNDTLTGAGGADQLFGGSGTDLMILDASSLFIGGTTADGGTGSDTLRLTSGANVTLGEADILGKVSATEVLDFSAGNVDVTAAFSASEMSSITGETGAANQLRVQVDTAGDNVVGSGFVSSSINGAETIYNYVDGSRLIVEQI
jgi:Ca2+-binding RTX toxin-like protein